MNLQSRAADLIQVVYADVLKKNVKSTRRSMPVPISSPSRRAMDRRPLQVESAMRMLLKSYGLSVVEVAGLVRVVPDNASQGDLPGIRYGLLCPKSPFPCAPFFQLIPLQSVRQTDVVNWLRTLFGERVRVQRRFNAQRGTHQRQSRQCEGCRRRSLCWINRHSRAARLTLAPAYRSLMKWPGDLLKSWRPKATRYQSGRPWSQVACAAYHLAACLQLEPGFVFAAGRRWLRISLNGPELDRPNERGVGKNLFTHAVKHKDAELLALTLERLGRWGQRCQHASPGGGRHYRQRPSGRANVVVDKASNTLIFRSTRTSSVRCRRCSKVWTGPPNPRWLK